MQAKHTPGPWDLTFENEGDFSIKSVAAGEHVLCDGISRDFAVGSPEYERAKANAVLAKASPELLDGIRIAEQLASIASDWNLDEVEIDGEMRSTHDLRKFFEGLIAKATTQA